MTDIAKKDGLAGRRRDVDMVVGIRRGDYRPCCFAALDVPSKGHDDVGV
jgi:hypothetical protein